VRRGCRFNSPGAEHPRQLWDAWRSPPAARAWACPARSALLPIPQGGRRETELDGELRLTESHLHPHMAHVDLRHVHQRHASAFVSPLVQAIACLSPSMMLSPTSRVFAPAFLFSQPVWLSSSQPCSRLLGLSRVSCHQSRHQASHRVSLGLAKVRLAVLRVSGQQEHRQALVVIVINHPRTAPLPIPSSAHLIFRTPQSPDDLSGFRIRPTKATNAARSESEINGLDFLRNSSVSTIVIGATGTPLLYAICV